MEPEDWRRVETLFDQAVDQDAEARAGFLDRACGDDPEVRREVEELLAANDEAGPGFLTEPARLQEAPPQASSAPAPSATATPYPATPYRLVRRIGEGGTSVVYLAVRSDRQFERRVAIKFLRHGFRDGELERRFTTERRVLAAMDHPHIAKLLDAGTAADGSPYIVMEYVEGEPLDEYCERHRLALRERLELFRRICSAVHYAHQNLVVHRDLKPGNILVTREGVPKLLDFGIAKLLKPELAGEGMVPTVTWHRAMTPDYASPEQVQGKPITTASDVYALGVILYRLLCGRLPHQLAGRSAAEIERILTTEEPMKPSLAAELFGSLPGRRGAGELAGDLDKVVAMALRKEPQRRYASAEQLSEDVGRYLRGLPVVAADDTFGYRFGKFLRRNRLAVAATSAFLLLILASVVGLGLLSRRLADERDQAQRERDKSDQIATFLERIFEISDPERSRGETVTAREILDSAAGRIDRELDSQPELRASLMTKIGAIYRKLGLYPDAERLLTAALSRQLELSGEDPLETSESLHQLGLLALDLGDYGAARQRFRRALQIRQRALGPAHPAVAESLAHLATSLLELGRYDVAEQLVRQALEIRLEHFGREHPKTAESMNILGGVLIEKGDYPGAEQSFRQALDTQIRLFGEDSLAVADSLGNLASAIAWNRKDYRESQRLSRRALRIWRDLLGEDHQKILVALNDLATYAANLGDDEEAAVLYQEALERARDILPEDHPKIAFLMIGLGFARSELGDLDSAETLVRQGAEHRRRTLGEAHFHTHLADNDLGAILVRQRRYEEAEPLLLASYRSIVAGGRPPEDPDVRRALRRLVELYRRWGRPEEAAKYRELLEEISA